MKDNKREHLNLPQLTPHESVSFSRSNLPTNIPLADRKKLLDAIGVFEVAIGEEEKTIRKSHFFLKSVQRSYIVKG